MSKTTKKIEKVLNKKKVTKKVKLPKTPKPKNLGYIKIDMSTMQSADGHGMVYNFRKI
jgi:hypothetical protein